MKMILQNLFAYTVLVASYAFDCAPIGRWLAVWTVASPPPLRRTNESWLRRCSFGLLPCPRRRYGQRQRGSTLRHQAGHHDTVELRLHHPFPQAFSEEHVNEALESRSRVVTQDISQRQEHLKQSETRTLGESAVEQFPHYASHPVMFEKQTNSCEGDPVIGIIRKKQLEDFGVREHEGNGGSETPREQDWRQKDPQRTLVAYKSEADGTEELYLRPDVAFVLLKNDSTSNVKRTLERTAEAEPKTSSFSCRNLAKYGEKNDAHYRASRRSFELSEKPRHSTCPEATQESDFQNTSFLQKYSAEIFSNQTVTLEKAREVTHLEEHPTSRDTPSMSRSQPIPHCFRESVIGGKGATGTDKHATRHQRNSPVQRFEALSDLGPSTHRMKYKSHRTGGVPAEAYDLIDLWSGTSHQGSNSRRPPNGQRNGANEYSRMQIRENNNLLNHDSLVTITYHFPFRTAETHSIAFILVALPPGYAVPENGELCATSDARMPALSCRVRHVDVPEREDNSETTGKRRTIFIQVSSADQGRDLPLGKHRFSVWVRNPPHRLAVGVPKNWWFVTFRFSPGHTITKHFENGLLHEQRKCAWTSWRQETPCSASCGPGFEVWTRTLLAGDDGACGPDVIRRKCELVPCNVNCQLGPWETVIDCTKSCLAQKGTAYQLSIRKVLLDKQGLGTTCKELYPWNSKLQQGWSDKLRLVIRRTPCSDIFTKECPADLGCRIERRMNRTLTVAYPWGSCPFPCGGIGIITSIIQVANGIPRWIGERDFPATFQAPCRADKEPIVTRQRCNTFPCEDCSVYVEAPTPGRVSKAWFFFLPSQEADIVIITIPPGVKFALADSAPQVNYSSPKARAEKSEERAIDNKLGLHQTPESIDASRSSEKSPENVGDAIRRHPRPQGPMPELNLEALITEGDRENESDMKTTGTMKERRAKSQSPDNPMCRHLRASFGHPSRCDVRASARYQMSQEIVFRLGEHIAPPHSSAVEPQSQRQKEDEAHRSKRPEWVVVPLRIRDEVNKGGKGNFYIWLMSSNTPRDPEVFTCQVKTPLQAPVNCQFKYSPVHPKDCEKCSQKSNNRILMLRRFLPPQYGGACNVPLERRQLDVVLVTTACTKGCAPITNRVHRKKFSTSRSDVAAGGQRRDTTVLSFGRSRIKDHQIFHSAGAPATPSVTFP